jgi:acetyl esterase
MNNLQKLATLTLFVLTLFSHSICNSQTIDKEILYKTVDTTQLKMEVIYPENFVASKNLTGIVFFFGGGWVTGSINQFRKQANYLSSRGSVCFLVDYRIQKHQGTTPFESLKDAKSAIRFIRENALKFHLDPTKIVASGGSAGGHLAAATALIKGYNENSDNLKISAIPNALVLFNPVIDNGPGGYGYERIGKAYKKFSPIYNIKKGAPPTIMFLGTADTLVSVSTGQKYCSKMKSVGSYCELILYNGEAHGFFNKKDYIGKTMIETDKFLTKFEFLAPKKED